jgi:hypothetical protein
MRRLRLAAALAAWAVLAAVAAANPPVGAASGVVKKVTANTLIMVPRGPDGRFTGTLVLKLSGTSRAYALVPQTRGGQVVLAQKETDVHGLQPRQGVAVIYAVLENDVVLLTAVAQPGAGR